MPYIAGAHDSAMSLAAVSAGLLSGILNLKMIAAAGRRLVDGGASKAFVLSSLSRVGLFAIVAVAFAALGPWWCGLLYIAGFFVPFALYALGVARGS
jgi:hypothetical protein